MKEKLNNPKLNIFIIFLFEIIGCAFTFSTDYSGAEMAAVIIKWIPAIIGLITIIFYFASTFFFKKYNWCITIIGITLILSAAVTIFLTDFTQTI